jgi:hypothetical protein
MCKSFRMLYCCATPSPQQGTYCHNVRVVVQPPVCAMLLLATLMASLFYDIMRSLKNCVTWLPKPLTPSVILLKLMIHSGGIKQDTKAVDPKSPVQCLFTGDKERGYLLI